eukprot:758459-Hanusia_phi.AAC.1
MEQREQTRWGEKRRGGRGSARKCSTQCITRHGGTFLLVLTLSFLFSGCDAFATSLYVLPSRGRNPACVQRRSTMVRMSQEIDRNTMVEYEESVKRLSERYKSYLEGKDVPGTSFESWRLEDRVDRLKEQGITMDTTEEKAYQAILRTRQRYVTAFMDDGCSQEVAESRADNFLRDPDRCVEVIWKDEKSYQAILALTPNEFQEQIKIQDKQTEKRFKDGVVFFNLAILLPVVLLYFSSLPIKDIFGAAQYYASNNCQAIGGIKCNGVGAQGQTLPSLKKARLLLYPLLHPYPYYRS